MTFKRVLPFIISLLCFFSLEACHHHSDDFFEEIDLQDTSNLNPINPDSIRPPKNPSDSTRTPNNNTDTTYTPKTNNDSTSTISFNSDTIIVAHWNIGNFALGKSANTTISASETVEMAKKYHSFLDPLDLDILGICEYDPIFSKSGGKAQEIVFGNFPYFYIGKKYSYNCNAVFTMGKLNDNQESLFPERVQARYYTKTTINVNGKDIIFVETHLDWNQGNNGASFRKKQIDYLIETFKNVPHVILCADFNTSNIHEFQPFVDAGFTLANGGAHGTINTYSSSNPKSPIDNIIVKGFNILNVKVTGDNSLSDHLLIKGVLVLKY